MEDKKKRMWRFPEGLKPGKLKKDQILILFLAGVLLLVIAIPVGGKKEEDRTDDDTGEALQFLAAGGETDYVQYLETHLAQLLSQLDGAGDVTVMVTLESSAEKVVEKDVETEEETVTESDSQGGERTTRNTTSAETSIYDGENSQSPYVSKELSPRIQGVVVLAQGGDDAVVIRNITEAVQALFGIDTHKIRIMKKN